MVKENNRQESNNKKTPSYTEKKDTSLFKQYKANKNKILESGIDNVDKQKSLEDWGVELQLTNIKLDLLVKFCNVSYTSNITRKELQEKIKFLDTINV